MDMVISEDLKWTEYTVYYVTVKLLEIFSKLEVAKLSSLHLSLFLLTTMISLQSRLPASR
jgi:hypothetical protein